MKIFFKDASEAYSFQKWLKAINITSDLVNELKAKVPYSLDIHVEGFQAEWKVDDAFGKFLLSRQCYDYPVERLIDCSNCPKRKG